MGFSFPVRVPYFQVDQQGVVFNMWYLAWFDEAMSDFLTAVGVPYDVLTASGADVQLVHSEIDWRDAVRYGDDVQIEVAVGSIGTTSFSLTFAVRKDTETVADARTVYVVVGVDGSGKRPIPAELRAALAGPGAAGDRPQATRTTGSPSPSRS